MKRELGKSLQLSLEAVADEPSKPLKERVKIVISIQNKDELKQFRIYMVYSPTNRVPNLFVHVSLIKL